MLHGYVVELVFAGRYKSLDLAQRHAQATRVLLHHLRHLARSDGLVAGEPPPYLRRRNAPALWQDVAAATLATALAVATAAAACVAATLAALPLRSLLLCPPLPRCRRVRHRRSPPPPFGWRRRLASTST